MSASKLKHVVVSGLCIALAACGGSGGGSDGANGTNGNNGSNGNNGADGANGMNGNNGLNALTRITAAAASATCLQGGVTVSAGLDSDNNGTLEDGEVTSSQTICNGPNDLNQLTTTTLLGFGDTHCFYGGAAILTGLDNGMGGGVSSDGILQASEVLATRYECNSEPVIAPSNTTPPAAITPAQPAFSIDTSGGSAAAATGNLPQPQSYGSKGGDLTLTLTDNTGGGHIKVFKTGSTDATGSAQAVFTLPAVSGTNAGARPIHVTSGQTVRIYTATSANAVAHVFPVGATYVTLSDQVDDSGTVRPGPVYFWSGTALAQVTSITVDAGGTLNIDGNAPAVTAQLAVPGDIVNHGTISVGALHLFLRCGRYAGSGGLRAVHGNLSVGATGDIINTGLINSGTGSPGDLAAAGQISLTSALGSIFNNGIITADGTYSGTTGGAGTQGGGVVLSAALGVYNSGNVRSLGGNGPSNQAGNAGKGGDVTFQVTGQLNNAGTLSGMGKPVIINSGTISTNGGACTFSPCKAGAAGNLSFTTVGGAAVAGGFVSIANSGTLSAAGGADATLQASNGGGAGGAISITSGVQGSGGTLGNVVSVGGSIYLSGNLITRGGDGSSTAGALATGPGGPVTVSLTAGLPNGQELVLLGYTQFVTSSGDCASSLGNTGRGDAAGKVTLQSARGGGVINYADIVGKGGAGCQINGQGSTVVMSSGAGDLAANVAPGEFVHNFGAFTLVGGAMIGGGTVSGYGGRFTLIGAAGVENSGAIDMHSGGADSAQALPAGWSSVMSSGGGAVTNDGTINANGGNANVRGSDGQSVTLIGTEVINRAAITTTGGRGLGGPGGSGGDIVLTSTRGMTNSQATVLNYPAATAAGTSSSGALATNGVLVIDGVVQLH